MNEWMNEWMNELTNEWMNEWISGWMNAWMNEWMNERRNEWILQLPERPSWRRRGFTLPTPDDRLKSAWMLLLWLVCDRLDRAWESQHRYSMSDWTVCGCRSVATWWEIEQCVGATVTATRRDGFETALPTITLCCSCRPCWQRVHSAIVMKQTLGTNNYSFSFQNITNECSFTTKMG
jgi:hypothetical protein